MSSSSGNAAAWPTATMKGSDSSPYFVPFFLTASNTRSDLPLNQAIVG